jgi:hypothetical protein
MIVEVGSAWRWRFAVAIVCIAVVVALMAAGFSGVGPHESVVLLLIAGSLLVRYTLLAAIIVLLAGIVVLLAAILYLLMARRSRGG